MPRRPSGSIIRTAKLFVPAGGLVHDNGGGMSPPRPPAATRVFQRQHVIVIEGGRRQCEVRLRRARGVDNTKRKTECKNYNAS
jgi:hypothetical protein